MPFKPPTRLIAALRKDGSAAGQVFRTIHVVLLAIAFEGRDNHARDLDRSGSGPVSEVKSPEEPVCCESEKGQKQRREEDPADPSLEKLPNCHNDAPRMLRLA